MDFSGEQHGGPARSNGLQEEKMLQKTQNMMEKMNRMQGIKKNSTTEIKKILFLPQNMMNFF